MTKSYHIERDTLVLTRTFASAAEAITSLCAPAWAGAKPDDAVVSADGRAVKVRGELHQIVEGSYPLGVNVKEWRKSAQSASAAKVKSDRHVVRHGIGSSFDQEDADERRLSGGKAY